MKFKICKLKFVTALHIGNGLLSDSGYTLAADTIFSSFCQEMLKLKGKEGIEQLVDWAQTGQFLISDGFPYSGEKLYLPKPLSLDLIKQHLEKRKMWKELDYLPLSILENNEWNFDLESEFTALENIGIHNICMKVNVGNKKEPEPYAVGEFRYFDNNGMYFLLGNETDEQFEQIEELICSLQHSGVGGKLSSGYGRFTYEIVDLQEHISSRLCYGKESIEEEGLMTLSISLPTKLSDELLKNSYINIIKRSGFVSSSNYSANMLGIEGFAKKKNTFAIQSGSCVSHGYLGSIIDVSDGGTHAVYRYAIPLFWRLSR